MTWFPGNCYRNFRRAAKPDEKLEEDVVDRLLGVLSAGAPLSLVGTVRRLPWSLTAA